MKTVVTLTLNPAVDQILHVDHLEPDRKLRTGPPHFDPGGGGINVSRAIRRLGGQTLAIHVSGGRGGELLDERLEAEDVPHRAVRIPGQTRTNINVFDDGARRVYRFVLPGPSLDEQSLRRTHQAVLEAIEPDGYVVLSGSMPPDTGPDWCGQLAADVRQHGGRVLLDSSGGCLQTSLEAGVFLAKPNLHELADLTGMSFDNDKDIAAAAGRLIDRHELHAIVVSLGAGGAMLVTADQGERLSAPSVSVRSRIGAGDSMVGGIAYGLANEWSLLDAVRLGIACGAAAVKTPGTELCRGEDAWALYEGMAR